MLQKGVLLDGVVGKRTSRKLELILVKVRPRLRSMTALHRAPRSVPRGRACRRRACRRISIRARVLSSEAMRVRQRSLFLASIVLRAGAIAK